MGFRIATRPVMPDMDAPMQAFWDVYNGTYDTSVLQGARGTGKALALDTPLPTPTGWTTMGEVQVGDQLLDERGMRCRVTYATGVQLGNDCYEVEFSDGNIVVADGDHLWETHEAGQPAPSVLTTCEIHATLGLRHAIPETPYDYLGERRFITDIRPVPTVPVRCVEVDSPSHLYLCSQWIPTHNTRGVSLVLVAKAQYNPNYGIAHVGSTKSQGHRGYGYIKEYVDRGGPLSSLVWRTRISDTEWKNGSHIEVLAGTINAVSGGHPPLLSIDEFDLLDWQVFQQAIGMPQSSADYDAQLLLTSALYRTQGPLQTLRRSSQTIKVYRWSVFDAMEPCDGRQGRPACDDAIAVHSGRPPANPPRCPLWNECRGRAQYANGHKKRQDVINEFELTDTFTWQTQYLSVDAQRAGVVFENFRPEESRDWSTNVTPLAEYNPDLDVYWGMDEGYEDPNVCLFMQVSGENLIVFDEVYVRHTETDQFLDMLHQPDGLDGEGPESWYRRVPGEEPRGPYKAPTRVYPDRTARDMRVQMVRRLGKRSRVVTANQGRVRDGLSVIRRLILTNSGRRRLFIHPRCEHLIREMSFLRLEQLSPGVWADDPAPNIAGSNPDHACDSLRYPAVRLFGNATAAPARASSR